MLEARLRGNAPQEAPPPALPLVPRLDFGPAPLSSAQRRMWFFAQLEPESAVYNTAVVLELQGRLDGAALRAALDHLLARHEVLRTQYIAEGGEPMQVVREAGPMPIALTDLSREPPARQDGLVRRILAEEHRKPFVLSRDSMARAALIRLSDEKHLLTLVVHHIASDLRSWRVLFDEFGTLYGQFAAEQTPSLPPLPIQYSDFAVWQRAWLESPAMKAQAAYWREKLAGTSGVIDLPTDHPRPAAMSFRGAVARRGLSAPLVERLQALARAERATLFMVLLAAFKTHLFRLTGQTDLIVGIPTAGRDQPATRDLIGLFINTLPVRSELSGDESFRAFLRQVRATTLDALLHQDLPFDKLVEEVHPPRQAGFSPLVQILFTLQDATEQGARMPGLAVTPRETDVGIARLDLTLLAEQTISGLRLTLEYSTDLFEAATADRLLSQYQTLLESLAENPEQVLNGVSLLGPADRAQLLEGWNQTALAFPADVGLHTLFERQAKATPRAVALVVGRNRLTYRELDARADRLARRLLAAGTQPEAPIGIFLPRTENLVIAVLAVLKAGCAYVPMDPAYPAERVAFILADSQAKLVITDEAHRAQVGSGTAQAIVLDDAAKAETLESEPAPLPTVAGNSLAYIIYTSGSTGKPKGVALEHRNAVAFITWALSVFSAAELAGVLAGTSICFDLSIFELFAPLSRGGTVILAENALALPALPAAGEVRLLNTVPSAVIELLRLDEIPPSVITVNLAGEPLSQAVVEQLYRRPGIGRVYDLYGPTETTTYSTFALRQAGGTSHIGRPIGNTQIYLLDPGGQPVPVGIPGEIYIGGAGVARGYLGRPDLTAQKFLRNPFSTEPGARMYRTGDLGRFRSDGCIECLGRLDHQVKIRGFRIELGEVEAALLRFPRISEVVAVARDDLPTGRGLVAYLVCPESRLETAGLRVFLRTLLPEPMIPSAFVFLDALPRTPNGKLDRARLPAPITAAAEGGPTQAPPRDELEASLVKTWETVLGISPVGVTDRFFDLGGHSLLAVRLTAEIEKALGQKLPLAAIFQAPTVAELAVLIRQGARPEGPSLPISIQTLGSRLPLFLVHGMGGGGLWGYSNLSRGLGEDQPVYAFKAREAGHPQRPATIPEMAAQYVAEMQRIQPRGPYYLGGYCFGGNVAFEMARILEAKGETVAELVLLSSWPVNRGHTDMRWTPAAIGRFVANLGRWVTRFWRWQPRSRREFFRWKFQQTCRLLGHWLRPRRPGPGGAGGQNGQNSQNGQIHRLVNLANVPVAERELWHFHLQALMQYQPGRYGGRVTLLRTRCYPFVCSFAPAHGWDELAAGGVTVRNIPGWHDTVMSPPDVEGVAKVLRDHLASAPKLSMSARTAS